MTPVQTTGAGRQTRWTREAIIEKIVEWHSLYGEPPRAADWNPSAAKWAGQPWRIERYRAGDWPSLNAAKNVFDGSLNAAIKAAGFEPRKPGPAKRKHAAPVLPDGYGDTTPSEKAALRDAQSTIRELEDKLATRERMLARERERTGALRERIEEAKHAVATPITTTKTKTKTVTKHVRVKDTATVKRLERKLERADMLREQAQARADMERKAAADVARQATRDRKAAEAARAALEDLRAEVDEAVRLRKAAEDRLAAVRAVPVPEVRTEVVERVVRSASDAEVAEARRAVAAAEKQAHESEVRAARAERLMREQGAAVTGEMRRLTPGEIAELRSRGPSGPAVVMGAMKQVVEARSNAPAKLPAALTALASAAIRWRDAL